MAARYRLLLTPPAISTSSSRAIRLISLHVRIPADIFLRPYAFPFRRLMPIVFLLHFFAFTFRCHISPLMPPLPRHAIFTISRHYSHIILLPITVTLLFLFGQPAFAFRSRRQASVPLSFSPFIFSPDAEFDYSLPLLR
jgi:hypothetical protein